ncbi:MAG: MFS transporter [Alphaproteobacteria bacterium]|nr:MFS transporter [Alphaproteobacteria bacterium]
MTDTTLSTERRRLALVLPWIVWGLGAMLYSYGFFLRVAPSVMVKDLMQAFAATAVILGNLSAFYFYTYGALQLPLGVLLDRWGARRLLTGSAVIAAVGAVLFGAATTIEIAYAGRLLIGAGVAVALIGTMKLIMVWHPPGRFATVAGMTTFVGTMGALIGQAPLASLVEAAGWRATMLWGGGFGVLLAALIWLIVRDHVGAPPAATGANALSMRAALKRVLKNDQTWVLAIYSGFLGGTIIAFAGLWGVPYAMVAYGLERPAAAALMSVVFVGFALGAPSAGFISDRLGRRKAPMYAGPLLNLASWAVILGWPDAPKALLYPALVANGIGSGFVMVVFALGREHNPPHYSGTVVGFLNALGMGSVALLQPLTGLFLDLLWDGALQDGVRVYTAADFRQAFLLYPACTAIAFAMCFLARESHNRQLVHA